MRIIEILETVLPLHFVQGVPVLGPDDSQLLSSHPLAKRISLIVSSVADTAATKRAATPLAWPTLELDGNHTFLIFEDADLDCAISVSLECAYFNNIEACTASPRLLVHDEFMRKRGVLVSKLLV
jgi:acyl-CoA reductase-like NAD-dependent aldehyde dehydrogenase